MLRTKITIDGDGYFMCIPPIQLTRKLTIWADKFLPREQAEKFNNTCLTCRQEDNMTFSLLQKQPTGAAHLAFLNHDGDLENSTDTVVPLQPILFPLDKNDALYLLDRKDFPNGTLSYGGNMHFNGHIIPVANPANITHTMKDGGELTLGDSGDSSTFGFMAFRGILCCDQPIAKGCVRDLFKNWAWTLDWGLWEVCRREVWDCED